MAAVDCKEKWRRWVQTEHVSEVLQREFLESCSEHLITCIEASFLNTEERAVAFRVTRNLPLPQRQKLFSFLLQLACESSYVPTIAQAREIILTLPRVHVLEMYEAAVESLLSDGDEWTCRRVLELAALLQKDLTLRLAARIAQRAEPEVRSAAQEFLENPGAR